MQAVDQEVTLPKPRGTSLDPSGGITLHSRYVLPRTDLLHGSREIARRAGPTDLQALQCAGDDVHMGDGLSMSMRSLLVEGGSDCPTLVTPDFETPTAESRACAPRIPCFPEIWLWQFISIPAKWCLYPTLRLRSPRGLDEIKYICISPSLSPLPFPSGHDNPIVGP